MRFVPRARGEHLTRWLDDIRAVVRRRASCGGVTGIPVWYRGDETHVGLDGPDEPTGWVRDQDVLDTWFSSGLWAFATLGWPERTPELEYFHPTTVLSTARDIINLWVARMVMMGYEFLGEEPVHRRLHPLGHPGARRAPHEQVARHRHRPAGASSSSTAPTPCGSAC